MRRKRYQVFKDRALYEEWSSGPPPTFLLECPGISLVESMLLRLGPGGIKDDFDHFALEFGNSGSDVESVSAMVARTQVYGRQFNKFGPASKICPLVFDTGASAGLTPFRCDLMPDYSEVNVKVQGVAGIGDIEGAGTILRRYKTRCGSVVYIPTLGYHMPKADIRLESPQRVIGALGGMVM